MTDVKYVQKYPYSILSLTLLLATKLLLWPGSDCDAYFSPLRYLGLFSYFLFFCFSLFSWGSILCSFVAEEKPSYLLQLGIGTIWISSVAGVALLCHIVGPSTQPASQLFFMAGIVFAEFLSLTPPLLQSLSLPKSIFAWILASIFSLRLLQANTLWGSTDPLFYHLLAPRLWLEQGSIRFIPNMPMLLQASYWEQLYLGLFQGIDWQNGRALLEWQISAQWLHCAVGYVASALLLKKLLQTNYLVAKEWIYLAILAALFSSDLYWTAMTAKNDWGICFWTFSGFLWLPLFRERLLSKKEEIFLAGLFFGFAIGAKYSAALTILPMLFASFYFAKNKLGWSTSAKIHCSILSVAAIFFLPPFLKNYILTGDPLFPAFTGAFHGLSLSRTASALYQHGFSAPDSPSLLVTFFKNVFAFSIESLAPLLFLPIILGKKSKSKKTTIIGLSSLAILFIYTIARLGVMRYLGPILPLCTALAIVSTGQMVEDFIANEKLRSGLLMAVLALILWRSDLIATQHFGADLVQDHPLYRSVSDLWQEPNAAIQIREHHLAGNSNSWLRQHVDVGEKVMLTADNLTYYLPGMNAFAGFEDAEIDFEARKANSFLELLPTLRAQRVRYILHSQNWFLAKEIKLAALTTQAAKTYPESIVFQDRDSQIIDLRILVERTRK